MPNIERAEVEDSDKFKTTGKGQNGDQAREADHNAGPSLILRNGLVELVDCHLEVIILSLPRASTHEVL